MTNPTREVRERSLPYSSADNSQTFRTSPTTSERTMEIVGTSRAVVTLRSKIERFARADCTVLIQGETGSGKELVARALHRQSPRARMPFVGTSIVATPSSMLVSELFGHERGAFTSAFTNRRGLFAQADSGTLFLDEIGELSADAQAALLRVLESREVRPIGAERTLPVDVRLIAATHRDLAAMVEAGTFREDLLYRLRVLVIDVPPLRTRKDDLGVLVSHLLRTRIAPMDPPTLDQSALRALSAYDWPGNVRQLENVLRRLVASCDEQNLSAGDVVLALAAENDALLGPRSARTREVMRALGESQGNISAVARELGIARSTVRAHRTRHARRDAP